MQDNPHLIAPTCTLADASALIGLASPSDVGEVMGVVVAQMFNTAQRSLNGVEEIPFDQGISLAAAALHGPRFLELLAWIGTDEQMIPQGKSPPVKLEDAVSYVVRSEVGETAIRCCTNVDKTVCVRPTTPSMTPPDPPCWGHG